MNDSTNGLRVPYVDVQASVDRSVRLERTGRFDDWHDTVVRLLNERGTMGATWRELSTITGLHHGQISGLLSKMHERGDVFALVSQRDRCHPYVLSRYRLSFDVSQRRDRPAVTKARRLRMRLDKAKMIAEMLMDSDELYVVGCPISDEFSMLLGKLFDVILEADDES